MPSIPALGRQGISEFKGSLVYKVNSRVARATHRIHKRSPVSKKKNDVLRIFSFLVLVCWLESLINEDPRLCVH